MSDLLKNLNTEFGKLKEGASDGQSHLRRCLKDTHEFKLNIKKLKSYLTKQMLEPGAGQDPVDDKISRKRQLAVDKLNKLHRQWDSGVKKHGKNALHQHTKFQKSVLNKIYDFDLDQVYVNQLPADARQHIEKSIGVHISRYSMSEIPKTDPEAMVQYLKEVYGVDPQVSSSYVEMSQIVRQLRGGNLEPCMRWCTEGSSLQFELHLLNAMYFLQAGDKVSTYQYLLKHIPSFMEKTKKTHLRHQVAPLLAQLVVSSEAKVNVEDQRKKCMKLFTKEYCAQSRLPFDSPLFLVVLSGVISFQFFIKYRTLRAVSHVDWSTKNELPFNVKLPEFLTNFHPIFICPVLKEETTQENPPYALPCHHIISKFSLDKMSKNGTCNFKCPYCPVMAARSKTSRVNFVIL
ncbi:ubiquitin-protein ligase RMD5 [Lachancea thermotolerans CBS 6340]|uniref:GID complex catalytic subunit 2 n=1 Tax=Lachancea thermotolerans (strain ATCC 56472 / CBS 6340 / NRRL Y-8284) TaxID=559295 RepID=C5DIC8_LACTC|nr:KLTH0E11506p [Lachancea thermotolerans CBS 6340]CAR23539.1 KLTH0E11506p [Lachancea thermotolerans CBS 6340]